MITLLVIFIFVPPTIPVIKEFPKHSYGLCRNEGYCVNNIGRTNWSATPGQAALESEKRRNEKLAEKLQGMKSPTAGK